MDPMDQRVSSPLLVEVDLSNDFSKDEMISPIGEPEPVTSIHETVMEIVNDKVNQQKEVKDASAFLALLIYDGNFCGGRKCDVNFKGYFGGQL